MKAQRSRYNGVWFRSRLEARWAMEFDMQHVGWKYEAVAVPVDNGRTYTPDFILDLGPGLIVEIKPTVQMLNQEDAKVWRLMESVSNPVLAFVGHPKESVLLLYRPGHRRRTLLSGWFNSKVLSDLLQ